MINPDWPSYSISIEARLSELTESQRKAFLEEEVPEELEKEEGTEKPKEKPEEAKEEATDTEKTYECVEGIEPYTWQEHYPDGTTKTFVSFKMCNLKPV